MKSVFGCVWLLLLAVCFSSCQSGKGYAGANSWGKYAATNGNAGPEKKQLTATEKRTNNAGTTETANEESAPQPGLTRLPVLLASAEKSTTRITSANQPEMGQAVATESLPKDPVDEARLAEEPRRTNRLAMYGLAASILSFLPFVLGLSLLFSIPLAIAGIWMSRKGMVQIKTSPEMYTGMPLAKAGLAIGIVMAGLLVLLGAAALFAGL